MQYMYALKADDIGVHHMSQLSIALASGEFDEEF